MRRSIWRRSVAVLAATFAAMIFTTTAPAYAQDADANPRQALALSAGFSPAPHDVSISAAEADIDTQTLSPGCNGAIGDAPDLKLTYSAGTEPLILSLSASGPGLFIRDPAGRWYCANSDGDAARLAFGRPQSGDYLIWVAGNSIGATLQVSNSE